MYERFTDRARKVMQLANQEAQRFHHEYIGTEHMLLGIIQEGAGVAANVLKNLDIDLRKVRREVEKIIMVGPGTDTITMGKLPHTPRAKKVIEYSIEEARNLNHNYVGTEHLLLGLLREEEGIAAQVLMNLGLKLEDVREEVLNLLGHDRSGAADAAGAVPPARSRTPALDSFGRDLTELARQGKLDPLVGRQAELERLLLVLGCATKNSALLVGAPGVGKSALVAGLARRMVEGPAPPWLEGGRVVSLDLDMLVAGSRYAEQTTERMRAVVNEARRAGNVVLHLGGLHRLLREPALPAAATLRHALRAGQVRCVLELTPRGYRRAATDPAFAPFQALPVAPLSQAETAEVLRRGVPAFESRHLVSVAESGLAAAAELGGSHRPGSAVRLLDLACCLAKMRTISLPPPDLSEIDAAVERLNQGKEAAVAEQDFEKAAHLRDQADKLKKKKEQATREWQEANRTRAAAVEGAVVAEVARLLAVGEPGTDVGPDLIL